MGSFSKKSEPKNSGKNDSFYLEFQDSKIQIDKVIYISIVDGRLRLDKSDLMFSLIPNQDLITVVPKKNIEVNKKNLTPAQMYILEAEDSIKVGEHKFILKRGIVTEKKEVNPPPIPEVPKLKSVPKLDPAPKIEVEDQAIEVKENTPVQKKQKKVIANKVKLPKKAPKAVKEKKESTNRAMNSLVRVFAIIIEIVICLIVCEFFDFSFLIGEIKLEQIDLLVSSFKIEKSLLMSLYSGLLLFALIRVISPLVLGVSLGQALLGGSSPIGVIKKRLLGGIREVIGIFTFGLIIFDLPSLIGKRTLKEVLSFSIVKGSGLAKTFLLILLVVSSLVCIYPIIPFFTYDMNFNSTDIQKLPLRQKEINKDDFVNSAFFKLSFSKELAPLPFFKFKKMNNKYYYYPEIKFLNSKSSVSYVKEIDYKKVLKISKDRNPFLASKYPTIFKYLQNDLKRIKDKIDMKKLEKEIISFTKKSYSLNIENYIDHLFNDGPIVKGFLDYRKNLDDKINKSFLNVDFFQLDDMSYIKFNQSKKNALVLNYFYEKPKLIKLKYENFRSFMKSIRKYEGDDDSIISLIDKLNLNSSEFPLEKAFEISFTYLKNAIDMESKDLVEKSFKSQIDYLNIISRKREDKLIVGKYVQNLSDALRSFIENDRSYFGLDLVTKSGEVE